MGEIKDVSDLPGVGPTGAEKLQKANYNTLDSIAVASPLELQEAAGLGEKTAEKAILAAREALEMGFESADAIQKRREKMGRIKTGSEELDDLLGGGVETQSITELYGAMSSGKSQWCFQLSVMAQKPVKEGGLGGRVLYIDSEGSFRPDRIKSIAEVQGVDPEKVLKNIFVARAFNADHQMLLAEKGEEIIKEKNIRLLVVDSLTSQFRAEYIGRGMLAARQQKLNKHMRQLMRLAELNNLVVLVTNQVMSRPDIMFGDPTTPIGGHIVGHACVRSDSLIQLSNGSIKEIQELNGNEKVLNTNWEKLGIKEDQVTVKSLNPDISEVYAIDTGHQITASPNHHFFTLEGFEIKEVMAKNVKKGDYLVMASALPIEGIEQPISSETPKAIAIVSKDGSKFIKQSLRTLGITRKEACETICVAPRQLRRVLNQKYPTAPQAFQQLIQLGVSEQLMEEVRPITSYKHRDIKLPETFSEELARFTGYLIGDGSLEPHSVRFRDERKSVLEAYGTLAKKLFNKSFTITPVKGKNAFTLNVNSTDVSKYMKNLKQNYWELVSKSPPNVVKGFIRGFVDAEGSVNKKTRRIGIGQKNKKLLQFIQLLLLRFGIHSRLTGYTKSNYVLDLFSEDVVKYNELVGITAKDKKEKLQGWADTFEENRAKRIVPIQRATVKEFLKNVFKYYTKVIKPRPYQFITKNDLAEIVKALQGKAITDGKLRRQKKFLELLANGDIRLEKVRRVERKENNEPLFDLSVAGSENYVANGFIVHNSKTRLYLRKSKGPKRVARLVDSPYLPDGEAIYEITEGGIADAK